MTSGGDDFDIPSFDSFDSFVALDGRPSSVPGGGASGGGRQLSNGASSSSGNGVARASPLGLAMESPVTTSLGMMGLWSSSTGAAASASASGVPAGVPAAAAGTAAPGGGAWGARTGHSPVQGGLMSGLAQFPSLAQSFAAATSSSSSSVLPQPVLPPQQPVRAPAPPQPVLRTTGTRKLDYAELDVEYTIIRDLEAANREVTSLTTPKLPRFVAMDFRYASDGAPALVLIRRPTAGNSIAVFDVSTAPELLGQDSQLARLLANEEVCKIIHSHELHLGYLLAFLPSVANLFDTQVAYGFLHEGTDSASVSAVVQEYAAAGTPSPPLAQVEAFGDADDEWAMRPLKKKYLTAAVLRIAMLGATAARVFRAVYKVNRTDELTGKVRQKAEHIQRQFTRAPSSARITVLPRSAAVPAEDLVEAEVSKPSPAATPAQSQPQADEQPAQPTLLERIAERRGKWLAFHPNNLAPAQFDSWDEVMNSLREFAVPVSGQHSPSREETDVGSAVQVLPPAVQQLVLSAASDPSTLTQVILDGGRPPVARFRDAGCVTLAQPGHGNDVDDRVLVHVLTGPQVTWSAGQAMGGVRGGLHSVAVRYGGWPQRRVLGVTLQVRPRRPNLESLALVVADLLQKGQSVVFSVFHGHQSGVAPELRKQMSDVLRGVARLLAQAPLSRRTSVVDANGAIFGLGDEPHPSAAPVRRVPVLVGGGADGSATRANVEVELCRALNDHRPQCVVVGGLGRVDSAAVQAAVQQGVQVVASVSPRLEPAQSKRWVGVFDAHVELVSNSEWIVKQFNEAEGVIMVESRSFDCGDMESYRVGATRVPPVWVEDRRGRAAPAKPCHEMQQRQERLTEVTYG